MVKHSCKLWSLLHLFVYCSTEAHASDFSFNLQPKDDIYAGCNTSLRDEKYLEPSEPVRQSTFVPGSGLYMSHVKDTAPMWCGKDVDVEPTYSLEFHFRSPMLLTSMGIQGNISLVKPPISIQVSYGYTTDNVDYQWTEHTTLVSNESFYPVLLTNPVVTQGVQFNFTGHNDTSICAHFDLRGCYPGKFSCQQPPFLTQWGAHCYTIGDSITQTKPNAEAICMAQDSKLTVIESAYERDFMEEIIPPKYFMGLVRQMDFSHLWHSQGGTLPMDYSNWDDFEPHDSEYYDNISRTHVYFRGVLQSENFLWAETTWTDEAGYICEKYGNCSQFTLQDSSCYLVITSKVSGFERASDICQKLGYELLVINNKQEQDFLADNVLGAPWTGIELTDDGQYKYYNNSVPDVTWQYWQTDRSTGLASPSEYQIELDCVVMESMADQAYHTWKDINCTKTNAFACEKETQGSGFCSEDWVIDTVSYLCVRLFNTRLDWFDARQLCQEYGGELAGPTSLTATSDINEKLNHEHWIGLKGMAVSGHSFRWSLPTGGIAEMSYHNFESGLSDAEAHINSTSPGTGCVSSAGPDGYWSVHPCTELLPFVCADEKVLPATDQPFSNLEEITGIYIMTEEEILSSCPPTPSCKAQFMYNGNSITGCTLSGLLVPWCSLYDSYSQYDVEICSCDYDYSVECTIHPTCVNSFYYGSTGSTYVGCAIINDNKHWCSKSDPLNWPYNNFAYCTCQKVYDGERSDPNLALPTPVRLWPLTEEYGGLDISKQANRAKLMGTQYFSTDNLQQNQLLSVVVQDQTPYSRITIDNEARVFSNTSFCFLTYIMWPDTVADYMIFEFGDTDHNSTQQFIPGEGLYMRVENRTLVVHVLNETSHDGFRVDSGLTPDEWHFLGLCYDFNDENLAVWLNGSLILQAVVGDIQKYVDFDIINVGFRNYDSGYIYKTSVMYHCMQIYNTSLNAIHISKAAHLCANVHTKPLNSSTVCEEDVASLQCSGSSRIKIVYAQFGKDQISGPCAAKYDTQNSRTDCMIDVTSEVQMQCQRQKSCSFLVTTETFFGTAYSRYECPTNAEKYVQLYWNCEETVPCNSGGIYKNGTCYYTLDERVDWQSAQYMCDSEFDNNLAMINSVEMQEDLNEIFPRSVWTTLNDLTEEGVFTNNSDITIPWASGYPMQASLRENCVQMAFEESKIVMNDVQCSLNRSYVCKRWYNASLCTRHVLHGGEGMDVGESLCTEDGDYHLILEQDGNLVLKAHDGEIRFSSKTEGLGVSSLFLDSEGWLYLYGIGISHTLVHVYTDDVQLTISAKGHLVLVSPHGSVLWSSSLTECSRTIQGLDFMGTTSESSEGWTCESWTHDDLDDPKYYEFPDGSKEDASNACRVPALSGGDSPGCYVDIGAELEYQDCAIPQCDDGYDGYDLSTTGVNVYLPGRCSYILNTLSLNETFFYPPGYEEQDSVAANPLLSAKHIDGEQMGGVCLKNNSNVWPEYLEIRLEKKEFISGIVLTKQKDKLNPIYRGVTISYSTDNITWSEVQLQTSVNNVLEVTNGRGTVEFDKVIEASILRVVPYCAADDSTCKYLVQCFRIDLIKCLANVLYRDTYVQHRVPLMLYRWETVIASADLVTRYMYDPAIVIILIAPAYVIRVKLTLNTVDMDNLIIEVHDDYTENMVDSQEISMSEEHICTDLPGPFTVGTEYIGYCERVLRGSAILLYSKGVDAMMGFFTIEIGQPDDISGFEYDYNYAVLHDELQNFIDFFPSTAVEGITIFHDIIKKVSAQVGVDEDITVPTGLLNDGLYTGGCLTLPTQNKPWLYIELAKIMWVAEVRITASYSNPVDDLLNLNIAVGTTFNILTEPNPGNCYENTQPFGVGESRSMMCNTPLYGKQVYIYKMQSLAQLSLCEVEVFRKGEETDIEGPSWESDWLNLSTLPASTAHDLGSMPIYGRILLNSGPLHENYIFETGYFRNANSAPYSIEGLLLLSYTENNMFLNWDDGFLLDVMCLDTAVYTHSLKNLLCQKKVDFKYKVQLWAECAFPRPSLMTPWTAQHAGLFVLSHHLGVIPEFGFFQITLHSGITFQVHNNYDNTTSASLLFTADYVQIYLSEILAGQTKEIRVLLWHRLGETMPLFRQTYPLADGIGPEKLRLPPYRPENSIIYLTLHARNTTSNEPVYNGQGNSLGLVTSVMAYNEDFLLIWWQSTIGENITFDSVTVTVYNIRSMNSSSDVRCEPLTINDTNVFKECSRDTEGSYIYNTSDHTDIYEARCDLQTGAWNLISNKSTTDPVVWVSIDGYEYSIMNQHMAYHDGVDVCAAYHAHVTTMLSLDQIDFLLKSVFIGEYSNPSFQTNLTLPMYIDMWRSTPDTYDEDWSTVEELLYGSLFDDAGASLCLLAITDVVFNGLIPQLSHKYGTRDCSANATIICQRPVCLQSNKMLAVPYKYRHPPYFPAMVYEGVPTELQCHSLCSMMKCSSSVLNTLTQTCELSNRSLDLSSDLTDEIMYGKITSYDYRCKRVKEPTWDLFSAVNISVANTLHLEDAFTVMAGTGDKVLSYVSELKYSNNATLYKHPEHSAFMGYFLQMKLLLSSKEGEQAFIIVQLDGEWLQQNDMDKWLRFITASSLELSSNESSLLITSCMPSNTELQNKTVMILSSSCPCYTSGDSMPDFFDLSLSCTETPYAAFKTEVCTDDFEIVEGVAFNGDIYDLGYISQEDCEQLCTGRFSDVCTGFDYMSETMCRINLDSSGSLVGTFETEHFTRVRTCNAEWTEAEVVALYVNRFCVVTVYSEGISHLDLAPYGITVEDNSFISVEFSPYQCGWNEIHLYQDSEDRTKRRLSFRFNLPSNEYVELLQYVSGYFTSSAQHVPSLNEICFQPFWLRWQTDLLEFGMGSVYTEEARLASFAITIDITVKYISVGSGQGWYFFPRPSACPTLRFENATNTFISFCHTTIECNEGYELVDGYNYYDTECLQNGTWTRVEDCSLIICRNFFVENSNIAGESRSYGDEVLVECDPYHGVPELGDSVTSYSATCQSYREFSPFYSCIHLPCYNLTIDHSNATLVEDTHYPTNITVLCDAGYELGDGSSSFETMCLYNRTWSNNYTCNAKVCGNLTVNNSDTVDVVGSFGDWPILVHCDTGYVGQYNTVAFETFCDQYGEWDISQSCQRISCGLPPVGVDVEIIASMGSAGTEMFFGDMVSYKCKSGYAVMMGDISVTCLANGTTTSQPQCFENCPTFDTVRPEMSLMVTLFNETRPIDQMASTYNTYSAVITMTCSELYEVNGPANITCSNSGEWSDVYTSTCQQINCGPIPSSESVTPTTDYPPELLATQKVTYGCKTGYAVMVGEPDVTCLVNGSFTSMPFCYNKCTSIDTTHVEMTVYVTYNNVTDSLANMYDVHNVNSAVINMSCIEGYMIVGTPQRTCLNGGVWSHEEPTCEIVDCGNPRTPDGMIRTGISTVAGSTLTFQCLAGYGAMEGNPSTHCQNNGTWTPLPICYVDCPAVGEAAYGSVSSDNVTSGSVVTVTCVNQSYHIQGEDSIVCGKHGAWNSSLPNCTHVPVDGFWSAWTGWSGCSQSCGEGTRTRTRTCTPPEYGGTPCQGEAAGSEVCQLIECDIDGVWSQWSVWSECTASCEGGTRSLTRQCVGHAGNGLLCQGQSLQQAQCNVKSCPIVSCHTAPVVVHTVATGLSRDIGAVVVYQCEDPVLREFADGSKEKVITCSKFGTWDPSFVPSCHYKRCPDIPLPLHSVRDTDESFIYTTAEYSCEVGYEFPDSSDRTTVYCQEDQTWTSVPPRCHAKECRILEEYSTGQAEQIMDYFSHTISVGDELQLSCEDGRRFQTGQTELQIKCAASLPEFTFACQTHYCSPPPAVDNAMITEYSSAHVLYECFEGYRFETGHRTKIITCNTVTWSEVVIKPCSIITCPPVPEVDFASPNDSSAVYRTVIEYTCLPGYIFPDKTNTHAIICQETRMWTDALHCQEVICGEPPDVGNATRLYTAVVLKAEAHYECDPYHRLSDGYTEKTISCTETGDWQDIDTACLIERCEPVSVPENAVSNTSLAIIDTVANISCKPGYLIEESGDTFQLTLCNRTTKYWMVQPKSCIPTQCPALPFSSPVQLSTAETHYTIMVNITCDYGYFFNVSSDIDFDGDFITVNCGLNNQWNSSLDDITCQKLECPELSMIPQTNINSSAHQFGDRVTVECFYGFIFYDTKETQKVVTCSGDGQWNENVSMGCELVQCSSVSVWYNTITNSSESLFPSYVSVQCETGYSFTSSGAETVIVTHCTQSGVWTPPVPGCQAVSDFLQQVEEPVEASHSRQIGVITALVFATFFICLLALDIITYWRTAVTVLTRNLPFIEPLLNDLQKFLSKGDVDRGQQYGIDEQPHADVEQSGTETDVDQDTNAQDDLIEENEGMEQETSEMEDDLHSQNDEDQQNADPDEDVGEQTGADQNTGAENEPSLQNNGEQQPTADLVDETYPQDQAD